MNTILILLTVAWLAYILIKKYTGMTHAYKQASGHKLNIRNSIRDYISTGSIPHTELAYKEAESNRKHVLNSVLVFENKSINLLLYGKNIKTCLVKISYSDIKHYYYEVDESGVGQNVTYTINLYIALKQGSIEINNILLNKNHAFHYLHILRSKTIKGQQVKPTYNHLIFKHPVMHGRFIDQLMKMPQSSFDEQQRNEVQHQIAQDEANTSKRTHYISSGYMSKLLKKRLSEKHPKK